MTNDVTIPHIDIRDDQCYHCGEALPKTMVYAVILDAPRAMCCRGCQLASQAIVEMGLSAYYLDRTALSAKAELPPDSNVIKAYDQADFQAQFTQHQQGIVTADLSVPSIQCAACAWLIEHKLMSMSGIEAIHINVASKRLSVHWQDQKIALSDIVLALAQIGYRAKPFKADTHYKELSEQANQLLMRLGVSALGAMQAMMYAMPSYVGSHDFALQFHHYFAWVGLLITAPILLYAGQPFLHSAWRAIRSRSVNMDVPVAIALLLTFFMSSYATIMQTGEVYFESVCMFIAFLLVGRYLEMRSRLHALDSMNRMLVIEPVLAHRERAGQYWDDIPKEQLIVGDVVQVYSGETIPCDGILLDESALVSEALLTGEALPQTKQRQDILLAGSQNMAALLRMQVTQAAQHSQEALIDQLIHRAMAERPKAVVEADRLARFFVWRVLLISLLVFGVWWWIDADKALWATVAVLVATCPCALSLATPMVLMYGSYQLASQGFVVTRGHVIERLSDVTTVVFDKTGTLTCGHWQLVDITIMHEAYTAKVLRQIAGALELGSVHPIAQAILRDVPLDELPVLSERQFVLHQGIEGVIEGVRYRIGQGDFTAGFAVQAQMGAYLARWQEGVWQVLGYFACEDGLRTEAKLLINALKARRIKTLLYTGDPSESGADIAVRLGMDGYQTALLPEQKMAAVAQLQVAGEVVMMVGDGVNDGPVLAQADISVAMGSGTDLARQAADSILQYDTLTTLDAVLQTGYLAKQRIRQNLRWALLYNFAAIIPAAFGFIPPWLAALGMSLSSVVVIMNARRIGSTFK